MLSFRCPKCKTRLTADGTQPTVHCTACGQLCAIPRQPVAGGPAPASRPAPNPGGAGSIQRPEPPPLKMDDVVDVPEEVLDVSAAVDDEVVDVVAGDEDGGWDSVERKPRIKRASKGRRKGLRIKKAIWDNDDRGGSWLFSAPAIATGIMLLLGLVFSGMALVGPVAASKVLFAYGIAMQIIAIVWGMMLAGADGEGAKAFFWVYRWVYLINNMDRGLFPLVTEVAGIFFMIFGWAV
jgi:hypothetical protein